ncbi:MAG TPA: transcriptional repressor LexA [Chloroflexota bacterium]|jgi:repressor LexA|nr:transcriptional repressor LexA [Chloroflexota bacterium]
MSGGHRALTARQRRVLAVIEARLAAEGRPPTLREIGLELGIASTNGVRDHLQALIEKGYIRRDERSARGIQVLRGGAGGAPGAGGAGARGVRQVPLLGRVAAGEPVLAEQNVEGYLALDRDLLRDGEVFALRVQGDSMRDAGILDGDYVFVRQQRTAQPRDIVVALLDEETTVKRYVPDGDEVRLEAENPQFAPIVVRRGDARLAILGKVAAVLRTIK